MSARLRNLLGSGVIFLILAIGALVRIDRLSKEAAAGDPRFLTLGQLARQLATEKQTFDLVLSKLGAGPGSFGLLQEAQLGLMRKSFELGDYQALDAQPRVTLDDLRDGLGLLASKRGTVTVDAGPTEGDPRKLEWVEQRPEPLGIPSGKPPLTGEPYQTEIGLELKWGDRLDVQKAKRGRDSERLASVLEGLALGAVKLENGLDSPRALLASLIASGHQVLVLDQRLAANFGDLERRGKPVATPLWVATGVNTKTGVPIDLPVPHAQLVLQVRGPQVNADVTFYPSLDLAGDGSGGLRFRGDVTGDQVWCGGWIAHRYEGGDALKAIEVMTMMRGAFETKVKSKALPLDGYFALGVCTLAPALVEQALLGKTTLWPLTHDPALFNEGTGFDALVNALPHDGRGAPPPQVERLLASLPWATTAEIPFPALRAQIAELRP